MSLKINGQILKNYDIAMIYKLYNILSNFIKFNNEYDVAIVFLFGPPVCHMSSYGAVHKVYRRNSPLKIVNS